MNISRYSFSRKIEMPDGKTIVGNSKYSSSIRKAVEAGFIKVKSVTLEENERLDGIAAQVYNDSSYWWVIAAASGIGWGLQVPPGVVLLIPVNIEEVYGYLS